MLLMRHIIMLQWQGENVEDLLNEYKMLILTRRLLSQHLCDCENLWTSSSNHNDHLPECAYRLAVEKEMNDKMNNYKDGEPCSPGCLSHLSHPCEGCGRMGGVRIQSIGALRRQAISDLHEAAKFLRNEGRTLYQQSVYAEMIKARKRELAESLERLANSLERLTNELEELLSDEETHAEQEEWDRWHEPRG